MEDDFGRQENIFKVNEHVYDMEVEKVRVDILHDEVYVDDFFEKYDPYLQSRVKDKTMRLKPDWAEKLEREFKDYKKRTGGRDATAGSAVCSGWFVVEN